jgi:hypothetical protein
LNLTEAAAQQAAQANVQSAPAHSLNPNPKVTKKRKKLKVTKPNTAGLDP